MPAARPRESSENLSREFTAYFRELRGAESLLRPGVFPDLNGRRARVTLKQGKTEWPTSLRVTDLDEH